MAKSIVIISSVVIILAAVFIVHGQTNGDSTPKPNNTHQPENTTRFYYNHEPVDTLYFCGESVPMNDIDVFERFERDFLINVNDRTQIAMYLKRAGRFFPYIEKRLREEGLPDDLKYLAVAESALLNVRSPAGAAGFWQIMPSIARQYGLVVDGVIDERYNLEKSTTVAIKYLKNSYARFGNWALSAASYNMGVHGTDDELSFQAQDNYYDLWLNRETSRYLFRILAIKEVMENADKYGYSEVRPYAPLDTRTVTITDGITNLAEWAASQGTTYKEMKYLNPWIRSRKIPPHPYRGGTYEITLPASKNSFKKPSAYAYMDNKEEDNAMQHGFYEVQTGETLLSIANKCGLTVEELRQQNRIKEDDEIKPGMKLKIMP
ncbi:Peptidoglycan-binding LysM [Chloroherpeton thalassium ATCC 35110]|uniref:Peptidoglycan-binding LysM n=1 Tax=Chloroherpeton thalassium (strain ATCC 35110 / GB-78) TaxID=517418 RepID=B3QTX8_CHLT3|nr:lytic transglycosylase domain-containing protein [Chloroherpeton thalassium]ACF14326.1 Peptidoglycan-binding LysM [Chloroherpeton thalassium ATCC 35110]